MSRIRTVTQAYEIIHAEDPESSISKQWIYGQIKIGNIPHIRVGNRYLFDVDKLPEILEKLSSSQSDDAFVSVNFHGSRVRRI